jgi:hypothetical protein
MSPANYFNVSALEQERFVANRRDPVTLKTNRTGFANGSVTLKQRGRGLQTVNATQLCVVKVLRAAPSPRRTANDHVRDEIAVLHPTCYEVQP